MKKCMNCHQKASKLDNNGECEDCFDAKHPDSDFVPIYDYELGAKNSQRKVKA